MAESGRPAARMDEVRLKRAGAAGLQRRGARLGAVQDGDGHRDRQNEKEFPHGPNRSRRRYHEESQEFELRQNIHSIAAKFVKSNCRSI
ncbi:MAG: hypothetical protein F4027_14800 [Rhodospirillaceae bacterium]|nr:hypothetical protein [Rhodospirillaceae bacterium]MYH36373.1 hypothetical protein [Rhodospirillaceae bacterium]MYK59795.1 hypothetical protein [Rhodospirillaceae bacterium]